MFLLIAQTIYLLGDVLNGKGIDFICLNAETNENTEYLSGFEISIDHNWIVYHSPIILKRESRQVENRYFDESFLRQNTGAVRCVDVEELGISGDKGLGKSVLSALKVSGGNVANQMAFKVIPSLVANP